MRFVAALGVLLSASGGPARAFVVVALETPGEYLKWGPSHVAGTPGGVVTWGFLAAGTPGGGACGHYCAQPSVDALPNFYPAPERHNRAAPATLHRLQPAFQAAFDAWSEVADVQFRYVGIDDSRRPVNDARAVASMIRIGAFPFGGIWSHCMAGAFFAPPPNVGTVAGQGDSPEPDSVLCSADPSSATLWPMYMRRRPGPDDVAGARFLYGPPKARWGAFRVQAAWRARRRARARMLSDSTASENAIAA